MITGAGLMLCTYSQVGTAVMNAVEAYEAAAQLHRPADPRLLRAEMARMARTGLTPFDIASALRLDLTTVLNGLLDEGDHP